MDTLLYKNVRSGIRQGSILGQLLFLLQVNDLPDSVKATAKLFADDVTHFSNSFTLAYCEALQD